MATNWHRTQRILGNWFRSYSPRSQAPAALQKLLDPPAQADPTKGLNPNAGDGLAPQGDGAGVRQLVNQTGKKIAVNAVWNAFGRAGFRLGPSAMEVMNSDRQVAVVPRPTLRAYTRWSQVDTRIWVADEFDCDDFARAYKSDAARHCGLTSIATAMDYSLGHAYNLAPVLAPSGGLEVVIIEPQTDQLFSFQGYRRNFGGKEIGLRGFIDL